MGESVHTDINDIFDEKIIAEFRIVAGIWRLTRNERDHLKREIELYIQNPKSIDAQIFDTLDEFYWQFDTYYKAIEAFLNLINKMWKNEDAESTFTATYSLKYNIMRYYTKDLFSRDARKFGYPTGHFVIERKNWVPFILKCSDAIQNEWAPFYKKYWGYREWLMR